ncbi:MAG: hypothetical protein L3J33_04450 [Rhodobacteraceae bacterium]|nr:hypothetical protein [Paracoccaceae bacterium]
MDAPVQFAVLSIISFVIILVSGIGIIRSLTLALEAKYEFSGDSLTKRSRLKGFLLFGFWLLAASVNWSFFFDWYFTGSSAQAFERLADRAYIIILILDAMSSD